MRILSILALALSLTACSTPPAGQQVTMPVSPVQGATYTAVNQWYVITDGVRYAWDGAAWYSLKSPQFDRGSIAGGDVSSPECWLKVGGSHLQCYQRTPATYRDESLRPAFVSY